MLTDRLIKSIKLTEKGTIKTIADSGGLSLYITHTGKYWRLRYYIAGKQQVMSLGEYPITSLLEAREKQLDIKKQLQNGKHPMQEKKRVTEWTFTRVTKLWLTHWQIGKSTRHVETTKRRLELDILPKLGVMPIDQITTLIIVNMVKEIASRGALDVANRALQKIGQIFRFAIANGYTTINPVSVKPSEILPTRKKVNLSRIHEKELGELLQKIEVYQGTPLTRIAIKLMALTFVRTSELINAKWCEFDLERARWDIPAERMKMKTPHIVPLSKQAISLLKSLHYISGRDEYLFPSDVESRKTPTMSNNTILKALKRMGYQGRMTGHGFRGLASTILHEQNYNHEHIEIQLAHSPRNAVSAAYNHALYLEPRAKMMQDWADYLDKRRIEG